jgi:hypothetical protein
LLTILGINKELFSKTKLLRMPESYVWRQLQELYLQEPYPKLRNSLLLSMFISIQKAYIMHPFRVRFYDKNNRFIDRVSRNIQVQGGFTRASKMDMIYALWSLTLSFFN